MLCLVIIPFWLTLSFLYASLGVFHWLLSRRFRVDIEFPKEGVFSGHLARFEENEYRKTAFLSKQTLRLAAVGFFIAGIISFIQSISNNQASLALDSTSLILIAAAGIIAVGIIVSFVEFFLYKQFNEITIPWLWYDKKKGVIYEAVDSFRVDIDNNIVLLAAACFVVRPRIKKYREDKLGEGITIEKVSGKLAVTKDAQNDFLKGMYQSQEKGELHDVTIEGRFEDVATHRHAWWILQNVTFQGFEEPSEMFCFSARAKHYVPKTYEQRTSLMSSCIQKRDSERG